MTGMLHVALRTTGTGPDSAVRRIDAYPLHEGEINHQAVIAAAQPWPVVATAAYGRTRSVPKHAKFCSRAPAIPIETNAPIPIHQIGLGKLPRPLENFPRFVWKIEFHLSQPSNTDGLTQPRHVQPIGPRVLLTGS